MIRILINWMWIILMKIGFISYGEFLDYINDYLYITQLIKTLLHKEYDIRLFKTQYGIELS